MATIAERRNGRLIRTAEDSPAVIYGIISFVSRNEQRYGSIHYDNTYTWVTFIDELHNESVCYEIINN